MYSHHHADSRTSPTTRPSTCKSGGRWIALSFAALLLLGCRSLFGPPVIIQPTPTISAIQPTSTIPATQTQAISQLTEQYGFTEQDSGRIVIFTETSRFSLSLNEQIHPKKDIHISCQPSAMLGSISNIPYAAPPLYAVRYETIGSGICTIKNGNFLLTVKIVSLEG